MSIRPGPSSLGPGRVARGQTVSGNQIGGVMWLLVLIYLFCAAALCLAVWMLRQQNRDE